MAFQNIIQVGASGSLGGPVLKALLSSEFTVSILARSSSKSTFPTGATVIKAEFDSHESLVEAAKTKILIDAAIEAGQAHHPKRTGPVRNDPPILEPPSIIPRRDIHNGPGSQQEFLAPRYRIRDYLNEGKITYTSVANGFLFDWAFTTGILNFDFANNRGGIFDDGSRHVMLTTIPSVASSVLGEILDVVQVVRGKTFETYTISTVELEEKGRTLMPSDQGAELQYVAAVWGEKAIAVWEEEDESALVGLEKKDVKEVVTQVLKDRGVLV
ncbi:hypothetical protein M408DRAFT_26759 [Serendipita vermifera MAFF 305830]|uniref:NmrA-like domain-containing protein n=1 Tax=Serendipita vermifera MAFF 305830 TaxID=933852 RepID=A0A0C3AJL9_SERVB|nr:hypothetical protein M408DRAFT_26759 [Serendipita vermifera MAFF 305830]